jgi:penicillin G amidase
MLEGLDRFLGAALLFGTVAARTLRPRPALSLADRLAAFPTGGWPVSSPVEIRWDDHQIPFVTAASDEDLAVALGGVHAHLRLGQIELLRRLSQGRLAEMIGPPGIGIDRLIRTLDLGRAVPAIERSLPDETRRWLAAFVRGINHHLFSGAALPAEFALFGLARAAWSVADILILGRFLSADVTWLTGFRLLGLRGQAGWAALWRRLLEDVPERSTGGEALLAASLGAVPRSGSNSFVVSAAKAAAAAPLIASDPHLMQVLPAAWLIAGMSSPSYRAVGLMIPGLPFVALGRNPWIAWGGTSLHAASSDLVAVPADDRRGLSEREEEVRVRWSRPRKIRIRESPWGPIISDVPMLRSAGEVVALRWSGHRPSDEFTAMLAVNRARSWEEFRAALDGFAVPGQHMLYADAGGHIGRLIAVHLPRRGEKDSPDLVISPSSEDGWNTTVTAGELPWSADPPAGFLASANERPEPAGVLIGRHFSPPDRKRRLDELLSSKSNLTVDDVGRIQRDVHWREALMRRDQMLAWLASGSGFPEGGRRQRFVDDMAAWDGDYAAGSRGALAFELLFFHLARRLVAPHRRRVYSASWRMHELIWRDVLSAAPGKRSRTLRDALRDAASAIPVRARWGSFHRLRLGHPLALMPLVGRAYRVVDAAAEGASETVMKAAHPPAGRPYASRYGSTARHISDLSDPDRNDFALLGGQDGWLWSTTLADQVPLWRRGAYVQVPLRPETAASAFPYRTQLAP